MTVLCVWALLGGAGLWAADSNPTDVASVLVKKMPNTPISYQVFTGDKESSMDRSEARSCYLAVQKEVTAGGFKLAPEDAEQHSAAVLTIRFWSKGTYAKPAFSNEHWAKFIAVEAHIEITAFDKSANAVVLYRTDPVSGLINEDFHKRTELCAALAKTIIEGVNAH